MKLAAYLVLSIYNTILKNQILSHLLSLKLNQSEMRVELVFT